MNVESAIYGLILGLAIGFVLWRLGPRPYPWREALASVLLYVGLSLGLMAAGETGHAAVGRGISYLLRTQAEDGFWAEARYTATGFPRVFYLRYHGYPKFFPLWALARYRNLTAGNDRTVKFGM